MQMLPILRSLLAAGSKVVVCSLSLSVLAARPYAIFFILLLLRPSTTTTPASSADAFAPSYAAVTIRHHQPTSTTTTKTTTTSTSTLRERLRLQARACVCGLPLVSTSWMRTRIRRLTWSSMLAHSTPMMLAHSTKSTACRTFTA